MRLIGTSSRLKDKVNVIFQLYITNAWISKLCLGLYIPNAATFESLRKGGLQDNLCYPMD